MVERYLYHYIDNLCDETWAEDVLFAEKECLNINSYYDT